MEDEDANNNRSEDDNDEPEDFLHSMMQYAEDHDDGEPQQDPSAAASNEKDSVRYNSRKPLWWKKISGKPTKAQKRSMAAMEGLRLPKLQWGQLLDWDMVFATNNGEREQSILLELGFGTGDNLLALAHKYPHRCFVGAEVHAAGLGKLCQRMHQAIACHSHWTDYEEFSEDKANQFKEVDPNPPPSKHNKNEATTKDISPDVVDPDSPSPIIQHLTNTLYSNLRFYGGDGVKLLPYIPSDSLSAVLVTFPDPFPKEAQAEFRVVQSHALLEFHRILQSNGLFYLATDHEGHLEWCEKVVEQVNYQQLFFAMVPEADWSRKDWLPVISKYEQKGWNEGRRTHLRCWKVIKPQDAML